MRPRRRRLAVRVAKAEGRPPGIEGSVFRYRDVDGLPTLTPAPVATRIGVALRAARTQRQLSQSDLARLAGVSPSAISQAERGKHGLSLETLLQLTGKLNMSVDELLRGEVVAGYRLGRRDHPRTRRVDGGHQPLPLLDDPASGLRAYLVHLPPRQTGAPHVAHKGTELVAVANGLVQVVLANGRLVLRRGEVLLIDTTTIEGWRNLGPPEATLFWILRGGHQGTASACQRACIVNRPRSPNGHARAGRCPARFRAEQLEAPTELDRITAMQLGSGPSPIVALPQWPGHECSQVPLPGVLGTSGPPEGQQTTGGASGDEPGPSTRVRHAGRANARHRPVTRSRIVPRSIG